MSRGSRLGVRLLSLGLAAFATVASAGQAEAQSSRVVRIGVIAPLDAGLVEFGKGIRNSVQLAVDDANRQHTIPGTRIELVATNDSSDPPTGAGAASRLAADPSVIGVVGPYNSGVAQAALPMLARSRVALISPSNTLTSLTVGPEPGHPRRPYRGYFRMVASDAQQAAFLARSVRAQRLRRVAVVSETKAVSKGLADQFAADLRKGGGIVTTRQVVPDNATDFSSFLAAARPGHPDALFFGGEYPVAATLRTQATAAGYAGPLVGGDGIKDPTYISDAGPASAGTLASTVGVPASRLTTARSFLAAYTAAGFPDPPTDYGPYAYDAANVIIAAAKRALAGKTQIPATLRSSVISGIQATHTVGASGAVSFDAFGDTTHRVFTLYRVQGTPGMLSWVPIGP